MSDIGSSPPSGPPRPSSLQTVAPSASATGDQNPQTPTPATTAHPAKDPSVKPAEAPAVRIAETPTSLQSGLEIRAIINGRSPEGLPLAQSTVGVLILDTGIALPDNNEIVLKLTQVGSTLRALLTQINGSPQRPPPEIHLSLGATIDAPALSPSAVQPLVSGLGTGPAPTIETTSTLTIGSSRTGLALWKASLKAPRPAI